MPIPSIAALTTFMRERGRFRLACSNCCRDDFDGVKSLPKDWQGISREQSLRDSMTTYEDASDPDPPPGYSVLDWWTHIGLCPECASGEELNGRALSIQEQNRRSAKCR